MLLGCSVCTDTMDAGRSVCTDTMDALSLIFLSWDQKYLKGGFAKGGSLFFKNEICIPDTDLMCAFPCQTLILQLPNDS